MSQAELNDTLTEAQRHERSKYLFLAHASPRYGATNHGAPLVSFICEHDSGPLVDFGCGRNNFVHDLRTAGYPDARGLDFAFKEADICAAMHATGLPSNSVSAVTCFDALEHLLPEDVLPTLREMHRIAKPGARFYFSICTRPSGTKVKGEGLHPTVRPIEWWIDVIKNVGVVEDVPFLEDYVIGYFRD